MQRYLVSTTARGWLGIVVVVAASCAVFTPQLVTPSQPALLAATATTMPASDPPDVPEDPTDLRPDEAGMRDLYGNDVASAVAKYSFDATGSLYEVHSPQTELPRLASPKS
jgi:hypothetical protein